MLYREGGPLRIPGKAYVAAVTSHLGTVVYTATLITKHISLSVSQIDVYKQNVFFSPL